MKYNYNPCEKCNLFSVCNWVNLVKVKAKNPSDDLQPIFNYSCLVASILNKTRTEIATVELE